MTSARNNGCNKFRCWWFIFIKSSCFYNSRTPGLLSLGCLWHSELSLYFLTVSGGHVTLQLRLRLHDSRFYNITRKLLVISFSLVLSIFYHALCLTPHKFLLSVVSQSPVMSRTSFMHHTRGTPAGTWLRGTHTRYVGILRPGACSFVCHMYCQNRY